MAPGRGEAASQEAPCGAASDPAVCGPVWGAPLPRGGRDSKRTVATVSQAETRGRVVSAEPQLLASGWLSPRPGSGPSSRAGPGLARGASWKHGAGPGRLPGTGPERRARQAFPGGASVQLS